MKAPFLRTSLLLLLVAGLVWPSVSVQGAPRRVTIAGAPSISNECPHAVIVVMPPVQTNLNFAATLDGASQQPDPVKTKASGQAAFVVRGDKLSVDISFADLSKKLTTAHIHGPATEDETADVLIGLVPEISPNTKAGTIQGTVPITPEQVDLMSTGMTYVDLHSKKFPTGEIRGQIVPTGAFSYELVATNGQRPSVIFDGSTSFDAEGDSLSYAWYELVTSAGEKGHKAKSKSKKVKSKSKKATCDPVAELTLQYNGTNQAAVGVAQRDKAVIYFAVTQPGEQFTFRGAGKKKPNMSPAIDVFIDGKLNASFDTSGKTILPAGATNGSFLVVSGTTTANTPLCTPSGGCPPTKVSELTLQYTGTNTNTLVNITQKGKKNRTVLLYSHEVGPGEQFTFAGAGKNGDMSPQITIFVNTETNVVLNTDGKTAITIGQTNGDFVVIDGRAVDGAPLCEPSSDGRILFGTDVVAERVLTLGEHKIELEVKDAGCTNTTSVLVTVVNPPPPPPPPPAKKKRH
jgi:hypothetical protein